MKKTFMNLLDADRQALGPVIDQLAQGSWSDPFGVLGPHKSGDSRVVRTFQPQAAAVRLLRADGSTVSEMERIHPDGIFAGVLPPRVRHYRLGITLHDGTSYIAEDAYRFPSSLGELDLYLLREGSHKNIFNALGARVTRMLGVSGTRFAVWAPNASRVSVIGDFNDWDGRRHTMRLHPGNGIWEIFVPGVGPGAKYKFELLDGNHRLLPIKTDPLAHYYEPPPGNAAIVYKSRHRWKDPQWMQQRSPEPHLDQPVSIYEVHLGSWRRNPEQGNRSLTYREHAHELVEYVLEMGFTHIELLPVTEHPFDGSWGYQPIGLYAPTQRFGEPDDLRYLIDRCHQSGIGVIIDWVPAHFPRDVHGLVRFDGSALYEHADPRKGEHADWGTLVFNYGRNEVVNYLIGSALYWIDEFHVDGLRVDAVASMLYLDYSRKPGEWLPNEHGGNENLEAVAFIRRLNEEIHARGATSFAEESTAWPGVSRPTYSGGLGFTFKWNMGWMNDTLLYMSEDPLHRAYHHDKMTFSLVYAFNENFVLPLSHDEVVHGKRSLLGRMPGDDWQQFANLRAYYGAMFAHPGKKLLFMGAELGQRTEWNHDGSLEWHVLEHPLHSGVQRLVRDLNRVYRQFPALHQIDFTPDGFEWIELHNRNDSVFAWLRRAKDGSFVLCVVNLTPVVRHDYRVGVPAEGRYREVLNTDAEFYGGSGLINYGDLYSDQYGAHGRAHSLRLVLPPLGTIMLAPE